MADNSYINAAERGARITAARASRGLTIRSLASLLGTSGSTLSRYEAGLVERIPTPTLEKLASLLGVSMQYLQYGEETLPGTLPGEKTEDKDLLKQDFVRLYKPAALVRAYRAGVLGEAEFLLAADARISLPPRILPGDLLTIEPCTAAVPGRVHLLLGKDGTLCLRDAQAMTLPDGEKAILLRTRDGAQVDLLLPSEQASFEVVGVVSRLESSAV